MFGFGDNSEDWKATPKELRDRIDAYNREPKERRAVALERIAADPKAADLLEQQKQERSQRRGRSR